MFIFCRVNKVDYLKVIAGEHIRSPPNPAQKLTASAKYIHPNWTQVIHIFTLNIPAIY